MIVRPLRLNGSNGRLPLPDLLISLLNGLGLMALVAVLYGTIERRRLSRTSRSVLHGLAFGLGAAAAMTSPAVLAPGFLVDSRATFVAAAGAFAGPLAAILAWAISLAYRIALGGAGVLPGMVTLSMALTVGLLWRYAWFKRRPVDTAGLALLACGISVQNLLIPLLPIEMTPRFMLFVASTMTGSAFLATFILCTMMLRESRLIAREKSLLDDAFTDALTNLPNRRAVFGAEASLVAASSARGYVTLLVDIDHFKAVNDGYGHDAGDAALCILAATLKEGAREGDVVARLGGEEFVIVLPATRAEEGHGVAERLLALVRERRIVLPNADVSLTVSIGLAHVRGSVPLAEAIALADGALYRAKAEGRDRVCAAPPVPVAQSAGAAAPEPSLRPLAQRAP